MTSDRPPDAGAALPLRHKLAWVSLLSLASGLPYGVVFLLVPVYLREGPGAELGYITKVTSIATFAWTLKFLWAFLIDRFATRKAWILVMQVLLTGLLVALGVLDPVTASVLFAAAVIALAYASATQDIAVDGYTIELFEERELGPANGARVTAYRAAMIISSGVLVWLAGVSGRWELALFAAAALMLTLFGATLFLPRAAPAPKAVTLAETVWRPLRGLVALPGFLPVLLFIVAFKIGDFALQFLRGPFWVDKGFSTAEIGVLVGTVGFVAAIVGAITGGWLTSQLGVFRALWMLGLLQAASNLGYYAAAVLPRSREIAYGAVIVEEFTGGMGTAAFLAFLMSLCEKRYAASQYALLSAAFGLGRTAIGYVSGGLAEEVGYGVYFLFSFALAFPAFLLLPWVRRLKDASDGAHARAAA
ncbi:MAG TPA: MFS transporter [Gemmatimonadaceae bacterium]|nr:MFS transporter [Gemmatimonadaceae bacterium]